MGQHQLHAAEQYASHQYASQLPAAELGSLFLEGEGPPLQRRRYGSQLLGSLGFEGEGPPLQRRRYPAVGEAGAFSAWTHPTCNRTQVLRNLQQTTTAR